MGNQAQPTVMTPSIFLNSPCIARAKTNVRVPYSALATKGFKVTNPSGRRRFFLSACGYALAKQLTRISPFATPLMLRAEVKDAEANVTVEQWMNDVMVVKGLKGTLQLSRFVEPIWFLTKETTWRPNPEQQGKIVEVTVPLGFVTDLASIPRIFYSVLPPHGSYAHAAIIHDYLYWTQTRSRREADLILKIAMEDLEVEPAIVSAIFHAVNIFGGAAWDANARLKQNGERRILRKFPSDPTTHWSDWKSKPGVFANI